MRRKFIGLSLLVLSIICSTTAFAQTAQDLTNTISGAGVIVSNVTINCPTGSYGTFTNGGAMGLNDGVVLSTGSVADIPQPGSAFSTTATNNSATDPDLTALEPQATNDVCILEFDIIPQCDTLRLQYVFASEEYPEFVCSNFNDAFGFFINGPNPAGGNYAGQNIALIPGTNTGVAINTVNPGVVGTSGTAGGCTSLAYSNYYVDNTTGTTFIYDGHTIVMLAETPVVQCSTYHMKLAIADAGDTGFDSGVFLDYEGLTCPNQDIQVAAIIDTAQEGCQDAQFVITRTDSGAALTVDITTGGTATAGTDYTINPTYTFNAGQGTLVVNVPAASDGITEGVETAQIVVAWDVCGVQVTDTLNLYIVDEPILNFVEVDENCGACDGTATVNVTGGVAPFTYAWDAAAANQTTQTATNLCAGTYDVTVTDANGCTAIGTATIGSIGGPTINVFTTDETCIGDNDGTITGTIVSGGTAPFQWDIGGAQQANGNFTNLAPGPYTITVTDANGCQATQAITINPGVLCCTQAPTATFTNVICNGACDGTATANPIGAVGNITYNWLDGANNPINQTTQTATGLCPGTYTVEVTDDNCTMTAQVVITEPAAITFATTQIDPTCGNSDGSITIINAAGGDGNYQYSNDNGTTYGASPTFNTLFAGTYDMIVMDGAGCSDTITVTLANSGAPTLDNIAFTEPTCPGACDGTVDLTISGGIAPFQYSVDGGANWQQATSFTGVCAGSHIIIIEDANNCAVQGTVTLTDPPAVAYTATITDVSCFGQADGTIDLVASGGTGNGYQYSIDGGVTYQASGNFTGLTANTYNISILDANNCVVTGTETVVEPLELTMNFSAFDPTCGGACDGYAIVIPAGGTVTGQYTFNWSNGIALPTSAQANNLCAGTYTLTVLDDNGCSVDTTFVITDPPAPVINAITEIDVLCATDCNGELHVDATNATQFSINGGPFQADTFFLNLCPGAYTIDAQDANGCQTTMNATVNAPPAVTVTVSPDTTICTGGTATLTATAGGGVAPFTYQWDNGATTQTINVNPAITTVYQVTATDANGCISSPGVVVVSIAAPLSVIALSDQDICTGASAQISAIGQGGDGNYIYAWDDGAGNILAGQSINVSPTVTTVYTVTMTDGCLSPAANDQVTITVHPNPVPDFTADITEGCAPITVTFTNTTDPTLVGNNCLWNFGDNTLDPSCGTVSHTYETPGSYDISLTVTSPAGCTGTTTVPNMINVYGNPIADFTFGPQPTNIMEPTINFNNASTGEPASEFFWQFDEYGTSNLENPSFEFPDSLPGTYTVCLGVSTPQQCVDTICYDVNIDGVFSIYVPNAFSPDGDGVNDFFFPLGQGFDNEDYTMLIFDRWGELIYETYSFDGKWDGTVRGSGTLAKTDVYVWKIVCRDNYTLEKKDYVGHVTLIR